MDLSNKRDMSFWNDIDGVCIINLNHRKDRWEKLYNHLINFIPPDKIHRVSAVYGKELPSFGIHCLFKGAGDKDASCLGGRAGCVLSHRKCLELAKENEWNNVLILEDDAEFLHPLDGEVGNILSQAILPRESTCDVLFLGMTPYFDKGVFISDAHTLQGRVKLYRIMGPLSTHSYLVNKRVYSDFLDGIPCSDEDVWRWLAFHIGYDSWIANFLGKRRDIIIYGCYPNVCIQDDPVSDIESSANSAADYALGRGGARQIEAISEVDFDKIFISMNHRMKKWKKIIVRIMLMSFYYLFGFQKFNLSIEQGGFWGAFKSAISEMRNKKA